ncbi:voltage-gated potassium channel [Auriculariales sp. MPI-PUGE-AT-0066]|nr:voltage-gated potassium channel [Auriculariales sp. MPI-PUGE-AT-0066]
MAGIALEPLRPSAINTSSSSVLDDGDIELEGVANFRRPAAGQPWQHTLHRLLEAPNSSPSAFVIHLAMTALIVFSAIITTLETLPMFHARGERVWFGIETSVVAIFTVEYVARVCAWATSWNSFIGWFGSFFAIIDLLAILPYYVEIALQADTSAFFRFSILRTFRLLRVFRPFRYSNTLLLTIEVMFMSFKRSKDILLALSFFLVTALIIFSTLIYFAERGVWDDTLNTFVDANGDPSQIESIPSAAWFVLVTITTVGYGDVTPTSVLGRLVTIPLLLIGLLLIALPSFVLGREFASIWENVSAHQETINDPTRSPILFSAHPLNADMLRTPRSQVRFRNANGAALRRSEDSSLAESKVEALSQEVKHLQKLVERQSADMAELVSAVRNLTSHDRTLR